MPYICVIFSKYQYLANIQSSFSDRILSFIKAKYFLVLILWLVLTGININKAFHIDDTFHLGAAAWITNHPATPMSGMINWSNIPTPFYRHNQPPLFFYLIAVTSWFFGMSEVPLHLLIAIFTFLALFGFQKILDYLKVEAPTILLLLFGFCPAFIINQNVMTDVPMLAIILWSSYFLLLAGRSNKTRNYILTALLLSTGLLIKYSILPLVVVLLIVIIVRRDFKYLYAVTIPLIVLTLWSIWNNWEYGSIHFLDRPKGEIHIKRMWSFFACVGSIATFSFSLLFGAFPIRYSKIILSFIFTISLAIIAAYSSGIMNDTQTADLLNICFILNGFIILVILIRQFSLHIHGGGFNQFIKTDSFTIFLYVSALSAFILLMAPFNATRHILLIIPFILLYTNRFIANANKSINLITVGVTIILGLLLGISDYKYADYYRVMASELAPSSNKTIWTTGHWGWQWYSEKNGMKQYNTDQSEVKPGDYLIYPQNIPRQKLSKKIRISLVDKKWHEPNLLTFFSVSNYASMYSSSLEIPPWTLSRRPIDTIFIYRIDQLVTDTISTNK